MRRIVVSLFALLCATPAFAQAQSANAGFPARTLDASIASADSMATPRATTRQAVELSNAYYTRLTIHRYGSYIELPLFATEYYLGQKQLNNNASNSEKDMHKAVAYGLAGLFTVNTVTGVWNLVESRHEKEGRTRKWVHAGLMLASDAGFAYTGSLASNAKHGTPDDKNKHRNAALVSIGLATSGTLVMWLR